MCALVGTTRTQSLQKLGENIIIFSITWNPSRYSFDMITLMGRRTDVFFVWNVMDDMGLAWCFLTPRKQVPYHYHVGKAKSFHYITGTLDSAISDEREFSVDVLSNIVRFV